MKPVMSIQFILHDLDASFVVFIPEVELKTSEARSVLPETV